MLKLERIKLDRDFNIVKAADFKRSRKLIYCINSKLIVRSMEMNKPQMRQHLGLDVKIHRPKFHFTG